jgi:sugar lactone lactonase YvrE
MSSFADFIKGKFDGISLGRDGRIGLAPKLDTFFTSEQPAIWSVISAPDGSFYAATGHHGRVFRLDASGQARLIWTADRPEVFAIAVDKAGALYAASSPEGKIYRIANGQAGVYQAEEYFDPKTTYIWTLAVAPDGALFAGTSDGKVFRITAAGKGEEYYATGQANVTGLMIDPKGNVLAGTEPNGVLYRITAKNKAFALYDSSLPEIRAIAQTADGAIYAVGLGGALAKKVQAAQQANQNAQGDGSGGAVTSVTVTADAGDFKPPEAPKPQVAVPTQTPVVTSTLTTGAVDLSSIERSAIYRINPDNTVDTVWSSKEENVYDILPSPEGLWFGTDVSGRIYRLTDNRRLTLVAQTNESEVVRLLGSGGAILAATANMGRVYKLGGSAPKGVYESPVFDAGSISRWGKLRWQSAGAVAFRTRSGNSLRPDETWSDWSAPLTNAGAQIASPNARYLQFEANLSGSGASVDSVSAAYLPQNNPPQVRSITVLTQAVAASGAKTAADKSSGTSSASSVPYSITVSDSGDAATPTASTGTPTQTLSRAASQQLTISWQADDPDNDKLVYQVDFKGDGERDWKLLRKGIHDNTYSIDGDALADGRYLFRVTASDREANPPAVAKEADLVSSPVLIDNTPPMIRIQSATRAAVVFEAQDSASALRRAEWSVDAGPWTPLAPVDGIMDSLAEQFRFTPEGVPDGEHVIVIRVVDSGNNTALARVILR